MRIVLTDRSIDSGRFPKDTRVVEVTYRNVNAFNYNGSVVAIAGSRALAKKVNQMELPGLKLFQLTSAGFDGVPLREFKEKGIIVANAGSTYSVPIAETVVLGMLLMAKRLHSNPNNRHCKIQRHYTQIIELLQKKVIILGAGSIGTEIAKRLVGFDMIVDGYAQRTGTRPYFNTIMCHREELITCISDYDYVISTLPDNDKTKEFFNAELLYRMKNNAVVINVGREAVFNNEDLYTALKSKKIGGAVLDIFEKFPNPVTNKFRRLNNVIVLPGVSAISQEANNRLKANIEYNILQIISGNQCKNIIND